MALHTATHAQLSPGDLNRVHKHLEGLGQCTQCHEIGKKEFGAKCLSCHTLLAERIGRGLGLHASPGYENCSDCHMDHLGRDFEMIHWPLGRESFDHALTGFALEGGHRGRSCDDCHNSRHMADAAGLKQHGKDPSRTFLGLTATCAGCHQNIHGTQQQDCAACHQPAGWKPATGFDHDAAAFSLAGAHSELACDQCHARTEKGIVFQPLAHDSCLACHGDQHGPQLSRDCLSCHTMEGWRPPARFDHARAEFALTGAHLQADCLACHDEKITLAGGHLTTRYKGLAAGKCSDCHQDQHAGRLGKDCSSCHETAAWKNYSRKRFDHGLTRYPLEGRHTRVACEACHRAGPNKFAPAYEHCSDCHSDAHRGQLTAGADSVGCESCHAVAGFAPALYSLERHDKTDFPLLDSHRAVPCFACHAGAPAASGHSGWRFTFENQQCSACHENPHGAEVAGQATDGDPCAVCHTESAWTQVRFDHETTGFALTGAHAIASCRACHDPGLAAPTFAALSQLCEDCHGDYHQGQFRPDGGGDIDCARCHVTRDWLAEKFIHDRDAAFRLEGAHLNTDCLSCHPPMATPAGPITRFKPISQACEDCHSQLGEERP